MGLIDYFCRSANSMQRPLQIIFALVLFCCAVTAANAQDTAVKQAAVGGGGFQRWLDEKPGGLYNNTSFAIVSQWGNLFSGMQTTFGYKFNPHLGIGGGLGIERFSDLPTYSGYSANFTFMPVFAEFRYTVLKGRVSPVIALQGGYKFLVNRPSSQMDEWMEWVFPPYSWTYNYNWDSYSSGGMFANIEIGLNVKIYKRFGLYASLDYSAWSVQGTNNFWSYQYIAVNPETQVILREYYDNVIAYQDIFLFRLGFTF